MDAIDKVIALRPDRIAFYSYAHVPWLRPGQRAYSEADLPDADTKLDLFVKGRQRLLDAGYCAIGFDHFALPSDSLCEAYRAGTVHRNFMGYTDLRTSQLIGLGVSSISDLGSAFAQNAKSVEGYIEKVNTGALPAVKGHLLDADELFIRKHILRLICSLHTSFAGAPEAEKAYMRANLPKLATAEADGLVLIEGDEIQITPKGQFVVRNICAAFDRDYTAEISSGKFSMAI
jgi:oxygen-independent coproporphyrinogen-3 oxidase